MSHHFFTKKLWISLVAVMLLAGVFFGGVYVWLDQVQQYIVEAQLPTEKEAKTEQEMEEKTASEEQVASQEIAMAALQTEKPVNQMEQEIQFPCTIRIVNEEIGVYHAEGGRVKKLRQVGEYLSAADKERLHNGIQVNDEKELIMVLESYHLQ